MTHPLFYAVAKLHARRQLRKSGKSIAEVNDAMGECDETLIDTAVQSAGGVLPAFGADEAGAVVGAIGDGHIIKIITDFFSSPLGQAIMKIILALLTSLIAL